jgi:hypothetical protein
MKPAIEIFKDYLRAKQIRFEASRPNVLWFSLMIPTPECSEMPTRILSCSASVPNPGDRTLLLSATLMTVELTEDLLKPVTSFFMRYQSMAMKAGRILIHPDGSIFYQQTQFLCHGGTCDAHAISTMITTAILEMAAIFLVKDEVVTLLPTATVSRFGLA